MTENRHEILSKYNNIYAAIWSPLLFDLFIRNVPQRVREALCLFYADDLTLQKDVDREDGAAQRAVEELKDDLQRLYEFGKEWLLEFEPTKSQDHHQLGCKSQGDSPSSIHGGSDC